LIDWLKTNQSPTNVNMTRPLVIAAPLALHGPIAERVREFPLSLISLHFDADTVTDRRARLSLQASRPISAWKKRHRNRDAKHPVPWKGIFWRGHILPI